MNMHMYRRISVLIFSILLYAGCDSPAEADDPSARTVSFDFSGHRSGTFQVQGPPAEGGPHSGAFVRGEQIQPTRDIGIQAFRPTQGTVGDRISLAFPPRTGTHSCTCPVENPTGCVFLLVRFGIDPARGGGFGPGEERFLAETCTLTVEELTAEHARGSFSGSGIISWRVDGLTREAPLTITNGRFDAELHPE
jgi:hypothetical protein